MRSGGISNGGRSWKALVGVVDLVAEGLLRVVRRDVGDLQHGRAAGEQRRRVAGGRANDVVDDDASS